VSRRGRSAALPDTGAATDRGLLPGTLIVRCFAQKGSAVQDFDFSQLAAAPDIQRGLAIAFARRTAPGAGLNALESMRSSFRVARQFTQYLTTGSCPPVMLSDVTPDHIDGFQAYRNHAPHMPMELGTLKTLLLRAADLPESLTAKLHEANPRYVSGADPKTSYSRAEFKRISDAARADLRTAAARIRANRALLARYRAGEVADPDRRLELLDFVDRHGDVPRNDSKSNPGTHNIESWVQRGRFGGVMEIVSWLHLTGLEATAAATLLAVMTGENISVILDAPAAHHRADGHTGGAATAILDTCKPRRGKSAYMNLAVAEVPDWISIPQRPERLSGRDELHTPFGAYALILELTAGSREVTGSDRLLIGYHPTGGHRGWPRGLRIPRGTYCFRAWAHPHNLPSDQVDASGPRPLNVLSGRIRLTYLELHQKPVAHTETTLVNDYLGRNRGNFAAYREVVAAALGEQVDKARARGVMDVVTKAEVERAGTDAEAIAAEHQVDAATLQRMLDGDLDTVMNACVDNGNSPHAPAGEPCRASFMTCLDCPCARALPRHLPIQALVHDRLADGKAQMSPVTWAQRFALPHAQLTDLLARHDPIDVADARAAATDTDRALVTRFVNRELDLR
jgi:hypothetical protein